MGPPGRLPERVVLLRKLYYNLNMTLISVLVVPALRKGPNVPIHMNRRRSARALSAPSALTRGGRGTVRQHRIRYREQR